MPGEIGRDSTKSAITDAEKAFFFIPCILSDMLLAKAPLQAAIGIQIDRRVSDRLISPFETSGRQHHSKRFADGLEMLHGAVFGGQHPGASAFWILSSASRLHAICVAATVRLRVASFGFHVRCQVHAVFRWHCKSPGRGIMTGDQDCCHALAPMSTGPPRPVFPIWPVLRSDFQDARTPAIDCTMPRLE